MYVKPWNDYSRKKLQQLMKDGVVYTDNIEFTRTFGRRYPSLFDGEKGFADIARIKKRKESVIVKRPNVGIAPVLGPPTQPSKLKFQFFKIF